MTLRRKILLVIGLPFFILLGIILFVSYNYLVVEDVPMYRVLGEFQEYYVLNLLIVGLFLVFGILVLVFLDRMLLKRFFQLRNSVSRIGVGGDFSRRVEVKGHDELADLAEEVNSMLVTLEWAHSELRESEKRFQRITDNMLDMIAQLNTDGIFLYVSPSHQSVLGYTKGQMVGEALVSFVHKADLKKVVDFLKAAAHNYALYKLEFRMKHVEGHNVWVESVGSYLRDKYGQVTGIILSSRDITDRKQAEGALKDSEEKHSQIVANIEEGYYEVDLAGKFTYFNNSLARIIGCGAEELQGRDPEREVELVTQPNVVVRGDPRLLRILMENLLSNAWKFTAKKPRAKVEFGAMLDGENMAYYVKDDGAGFEMEYVDKLFGPFQRLHSPEDFSGTGVGLATVARIVRRHGGGVWAEGAVDEGATFYFTL